MKSSLLKGGGITIAGRAISSLTALIVSSVAAHTLSKENFAYYYMLLSAAALAALLFDGGARQALLRFSSLSFSNAIKTSQSGLLKWGVFRILAATSFTSSVTLLATMVLAPEFVATYRPDLLVAGAWGVFLALVAAAAEALRAHRRYLSATSYLNLFPALVQTLCIAYFWVTKNGLGLPDLITASIVSVAIAALIAWSRAWSAARSCEAFEDSDERRKFRAMANAALPSAVFSFLLVNIDYWIVVRLCSSEDAALYAAAVRLLVLVQLPLQFVNVIVAPHIANNGDAASIKRSEIPLRAMATIAGVPSVLLLVGYATFGSKILETLYGDEYGAAWSLLAVLSVGQFINVLTGSCGLLLSMSGYAHILRNYVAISVVCFVFACWLLTLRYGVLGAATSASGTLALLNCITLLDTRFRLGVWTHVSLLAVSGFLRSQPLSKEPRR